jgi:hypothetical protein
VHKDVATYQRVLREAAGTETRKQKPEGFAQKSDLATSKVQSNHQGTLAAASVEFEAAGLMEEHVCNAENIHKSTRAIE